MSVDRSTEELSHFMSQLDMNAKPSVESKGEISDECLFNISDCCDINDSHRHSGPSKSRNSSEYHSNSADLHAHMHGATPVPQKLNGRPPRLSLQSMPCRTAISMNIDINCNMSSNEFVFT